jgi:hypothetical protein
MQRFISISLLLFSLSLVPAIAQTLYLDSCGLDKSSILNQYEVHYIDSVFITPVKLRKGRMYDATNGFIFTNKNIAFHSCSYANGSDGFITKDKFFDFIKPTRYQGPHGVYILTGAEKIASGGFDAILLLNCKAYNQHSALNSLKQRRNVNNLLPGQK